MNEKLLTAKHTNVVIFLRYNCNNNNSNKSQSINYHYDNEIMEFLSNYQTNGKYSVEILQKSR